MNLSETMDDGKFQINDEFPNEAEILNESFDSEDQKSPEEVRGNILNFWCLDPLRQKKYVRNFSSICQLLGQGSFLFIVEHLYPPKRTLVESRPELANLLMENIQMLFKIMSMNPLFQNSPNKQNTIMKIVLNFLAELIESNVSNLLAVSRRTLIKVGPFLSRECCDNELLSIVLTLLHDPTNESNNISALEMLKQMNTLFSEEYIKGFIAMDIIALLQSPSVNIRIEACHSLFSMFHVFSQEFVEQRFLTVIEGLTKDSNFAVTNHLIKNMPVLAKKISFAVFEKYFFPKFIEYLSSKNRFQKEESLLVLGDMIISLTESEDETHVFSVYSSSHFEKLLETYFDLPRAITKMNLSTKRNIIKSNYALLRKIVLLKKNEIWQKVKKLILATEEIESILIEIAKVEIAQQLDAIAKICDKLSLEKDLIMIIDKYYLTVNPTTSQTVKQNTIKVLSEVLKELSPEIREKYADVYQTTLNLEMNKWRLRFVISEQIESLSKLFNAETIFGKIIPMYFAFCRDNCAVVRKSASKLFFRFYKNISNDANAKEVMLLNMKTFGSYNRFVLRQSFVLMAESLLLNEAGQMDEEMLTILIQLSRDKVVNVRITVARLLVNLHRKGSNYGFIQEIKKVLLEKVDPDLFNLLKELFVGDQAKLLEDAFREYQEKKKKAAQTERNRVEELKISKAVRSTGSQRGWGVTDDTGLGRVAGNTYRELLKNSFDLYLNGEAKELIEDLNLGETNDKLNQKFTEKYQSKVRDGLLKQFVDIDLNAVRLETPKDEFEILMNETGLKDKHEQEKRNEEKQEKIDEEVKEKIDEEVQEKIDEEKKEKTEEEKEKTDEEEKKTDEEEKKKIDEEDKKKKKDEEKKQIKDEEEKEKKDDEKKDNINDEKKEKKEKENVEMLEGISGDNDLFED